MYMPIRTVEVLSVSFINVLFKLEALYTCLISIGSI